MNVNLEGMETLYDIAKGNGKLDIWAELALEYMRAANKHIQGLESQLEEADKLVEELEGRINENI